MFSEYTRSETCEPLPDQNDDLRDQKKISIDEVKRKKNKWLIKEQYVCCIDVEATIAIEARPRKHHKSVLRLEKCLKMKRKYNENNGHSLASSTHEKPR